MNLNIDIFHITESISLLKLSSPILHINDYSIKVISYKSNSIYKDDELYTSYISNDKGINKNNLYKCDSNVLILSGVNQYFHNIISIMSKVLYRNEIDNNFKVLFYNTQNKNQSISKLFNSNKLNYLIEILDKLNIDYEFLPNNIEFIQPKSYYLFLEKKSIHQTYGFFPTKNFINPSEWIFDKRYYLIEDILYYNRNNLRDPINIYRKYFFDKSIKQNKKIFLSRKDASGRRFINNYEVLEKLFQDNGYEIITLSGMSFLDQVYLFNSSTHIVGLAGSNLLNIMFCHPGTKVLEILTDKDFDTTEFFDISRFIDLDFKSFECFFNDGQEIVDKINKSNSNEINSFLMH